MLIDKLRYAAYRLKYRYGKVLPLAVPVDISLELSSQCQLRCSYCYHSDQDNLPFTKGFMTYDIATKILMEAALLGVPSIKMNWKGESSINPRFSAITAYAKRLAKGSTFIDRLSNSNFNFPTRRDDIFDGFCNQTKVKISFDSFIKEVFETQRTLGNWETTCRNIDIFYNHPNRKNTEIVIQAVRTKLNKDEDIEGEVRKRWKDATVSIRDMVAGRVEKNLDDLEHRKRNIGERQSCTQAHVRIIYNHEGRAFPCCPDVSEKLQIGDARKQTVGEIFNGHYAKELRKDLKCGKAFLKDPCKNCSSFESYKGFKPVWNS